jgi:hypothetical protein
MAVQNFIPEIWSGRMLARLNDALVYRNVCTTEYEGEIRGYGDVVKINELGTITVNTYSATSTGALTVQQLNDAQKELRINQSKYYAFWLDDQDNAQTNPKLLGAALDQAAWSWANNIDEYISGMYTQAGVAVSGSATTGVDITSTNVLKYLSLAQQKHDEANTPRQGRWIVVPPWFQQKMTLAGITLDTQNSGILGAGYIGRSFYGFDIFVSNNVYHASGTDRAAIMCGFGGSIGLAVQVITTRQESSGTIGFKTLVKGLVVYGAKVIRPNNLGVLWADYTAEAS